MRFVFVLAFLAIVLNVSIADVYSPEHILEEEWEAFKLLNNKQYEGEEDTLRKRNFLFTKSLIASHNKQSSSGFKTFSMKLNKFADLTAEEVNSKVNGLISEKLQIEELKKTHFFTNGSTFSAPYNLKLPVNVDWRGSGYVTKVKDQKYCGSCYAFAATGALEAQMYKKNHKLIPLSEQNIIDCSRVYGNQGCNGGLMHYAFDYIKHNHGIDSEESYPYQGFSARCRFHRRDTAAYVKGYEFIQVDNEEELKRAVATVGPVAVAMNANLPSFHFYNNGVYYDPNCSDDTLSHAVLIVGYGEDEDGIEYWLIKNSWGTSWGENGYARIARNKENHCGISRYALYPLV